MSHTDTPEQAAVIAWKGERLVVCAFAGTGKTSTLRRYAEANPTERMLYVAYNRAIRDEAEQKFPFNVTCKTSHQLAWPAVGKHYSHRLVNTLRLTDVARALNSRNWLLSRMVLDTLNRFMCSASLHIAAEHTPEPEDCKGLEPGKILGCAQKIWDMMSARQGDFPVTHDTYLKLYQLGKPNLSSRYTTILFDEAQDANPVTSAIVLGQACRVVLVGDTHQQIYRFRGEGASEGLGTMLGMRLLPGGVILWLSKTPQALDTLLAFIRGDPEQAGVISRIVRDAIQHAGGEQKEILTASTVNTSSALLPAMPAGTAAGEASQSVEPGAGPVLSPESGPNDPLVSTVTLTSALDEHELPSVPSVQAGQEVDDPAIQNVIALMGFNASQSAGEEESQQEAAEQEEPSEFVDAGSGHTIDSVGVSLPAEELQPAVADNADDGENYGQQFISWLSARIISGDISVNTKDALVHIVGGLVFLPAPQIFFSFMKGNAYAPSLKNDVQRGFEHLGLHFMQKGKGVFSCLKYEEEDRKGRYERLSGYLIRSKIIYRTHPVPDDSIFLFVSKCN